MPEQTLGRNISIRDVLFVIFKHQKMIISVFLITVMVVVIGVFLSKPVYETSSKVLLNREVSESVIRVAPWIPLMRRLELEEEINSEIELIKSRPVVQAAIEDIDRQILAGEIPPSEQDSGSQIDGAEAKGQIDEQQRLLRIQALQRALVVEPVKKSDVIQIKYSSHDPRMTMEVVNAVSEAYIDHRAKIFRATGASDFFDEQIDFTKRNLEQLEAALKDYRQQEGLLSYQEQSTILLKQLNEFEISLTNVRKDIISKEAKLANIREYMSSPLQPLVPSLEIREERIILELHDKLVELRMRLNELLTKYTESHRDVRNLRAEIALGEEELRKEVEKVIELEQSSLETLRAEEAALGETVTLLNNEVKTLPEKGLIIERLERAINSHQEIYSMLVLKREETRISEASDRRLANVSVISPATLPMKPIKPNKSLLIFVGCLIGLIGGFGLAFVLEYMDHSLKTIEDVKYYLDLPVLASIPQAKRC